MAKVSSKEYDRNLWIEDVMTTIKTSLNDMHPNKMKRIINKCIEKHKETIHTVQNHQEIKSYIVPFKNDDEYDEPVLNKLMRTGKDKDNPHFDMSDWIPCDNKWKPPPPAPNIPTSDNIPTTQPPSKLSVMQTDSGANRIVVDDLKLLSNIQPIPPIPMGGCNKNDPAAITCTAVGILHIRSIKGETIRVKAYYSSQVDGTIISPTTIVTQHSDKYLGWLQRSNTDTQKGTITLLGRRKEDNLEFATYSVNDLWYHDKESVGPKDVPKISRMSRATQYELWHQRCGHAGTNTLEIMHKHAIGIPSLNGNSLYRCPSCMSGKLCTKQRIGKSNKSFLQRQAKAQEAIKFLNENHDVDDDIHLPNIHPGQKFHMDFGFVRGSDYNYETKDGKTVTSIDGYNSYLSIIDRATRYQWIFLTASKTPPIDVVTRILNKFKSKNPHRQVRVDQGGELGKSSAFRDAVAECDFTLELTGADNSKQNGLIERPNRNLAETMRCLLHAADLGPEFWSFALVHAVYLKNRLYHHSINSTPFYNFTGLKPDLTNLKIFGSKVYARRTGRRPYKLDNHVDTGIFLGYTATDKNYIYVDWDSGRFKIASHVIFDEAHMSTPTSKTPLAAQALQRLGYTSKEHEITTPSTEQIAPVLRVQHLSQLSTTPTKSTNNSIGYDIYSAIETPIIIPPGKLKVIPTNIAIKMPPNCYARIAPRSGMTVKQSITTLAGVIDPDFRGDIGVVLQNFGDTPQPIQPKQRIAQLILENAIDAEIIKVDKLDTTDRGKSGFGSTEQRSKLKKVEQDLMLETPKPYDIYLSLDPYDFKTTRTVNIRKSDRHPTFGLQLLQTDNRVQLISCTQSTSSARLPRWRSELRNGFITSINSSPITTIKDAKDEFRKIRKSGDTTFTIAISTKNKLSMNPQLGTPQLYHDQVNIIAQHLYEIKNEPEWNLASNEEIVHPVTNELLKSMGKSGTKYLKCNKLWSQLHQLPSWYRIAKVKKRRKLTRRFLLNQTDWNDWEASEHKQLDQYASQKTFGKPQTLPQGANLLPLLWTYIIKDDGTKKARCVCNGSPKMRGSVTLAETYAGALEQSAARIFWAASAINNFITIGADASNAFAEAPAPKAPLFVKIDKPYREWYQKRYPNEPPIPDDYVLPVNGALQGHPESARLWSKLIDNVIRELGLQPCTHEPCLYFTDDYQNTGKRIMFLRQVDDFAVSCEDKQTASKVINAINSKMTINVKDLGMITRFNGIDILQSRHYVKLYNQTYINKILARHDWIHQEKPTATYPIPMKTDNKYQQALESQHIPTPEEIQQLESDMTFGYRQAIGELIYAMITCRPDISYAVIKLSQYSTRPTLLHFEAIKNIYRYLNATKSKGIYYWRTKPRHDLPLHPLPTCKPDNNYNSNEQPERQQHTAEIIRATVDSDYASDTSHRRSVTGIVVKIAGGAIYYKTRYQDCLAHSSTEAEFTAAADAGKQLLYIRSILDEIGLPQDQATILYEDNRGALHMANSQQPTRRTRHMDIKAFALQDWVERDLIILKQIGTNDNEADTMTKATNRTLFYRHIEFIMGSVIPQYTNIKTTFPHSNDYSLRYIKRISYEHGGM